MRLQKRSDFFATGTMLCVCLYQPAAAQENDPDTTAESGEIDEIVVVGGRTLTKWRHQAAVAEDRFFKLYNELNEDDRYDIVCRRRAEVGTRITVRECKPQFVRDAEIKAARDSLQLAESLGDISSQRIHVSREDYEILDEKLKSFTLSSPEMQEALLEYDSLNRKYAEEHEKKFD